MKAAILSFLSCLVTFTLYAQPHEAAPDGGGEYKMPKSECVTDVQRAEIVKMLEENRKALVVQGILPDNNAQKKTTATKFDWPLQQAAGFNYNSLYAVSNYVDHDVTYPSHIQDWNCGTRSYDQASGYNHSGMDIWLWPFDINMMDQNQVQIVAAAPGVITGKTDGNFDKNCAMGSGSWNAVYVQHADGTVAWYGHMKKNSLTAKSIGASVVTGEVLGNVGSSGSSTAPHLHFEVHDAAGNILDPYTGTCNTSATMWNVQKAYYESTINALMTHAAKPVFNTCPAPHSISAKDTFDTGSNTIYFAGYYHDQMAGQTTTYTVYRPDNSVFDTWTHTPTTAWYGSSWWYWTRTISASEPLGKWKFEADYQTKKVSHDFYRLHPVGIVTTQSGYKVQVYPNPVSDVLLFDSKQPIENIRLNNALGQLVYTAAKYSKEGISTKDFPDGFYIITATVGGEPFREKIQVIK